MFIGAGTAVNVVLILIGGFVGTIAGHKLSDRTKQTVTAVLGLFTMVIGAMNVAFLSSEALQAAVGAYATVIVLGALIAGALLGSWLRIEDRLEQGGVWVRRRIAAKAPTQEADAGA